MDPRARRQSRIPRIDTAEALVAKSCRTASSLDAERALPQAARLSPQEAQHDRSHGRHASTELSNIMIAKNLERIADHCTNIAEDVIYIHTGRIVRHLHAS